MFCSKILRESMASCTGVVPWMRITIFLSDPSMAWTIGVEHSSEIERLESIPFPLHFSLHRAGK